MATADAGEVSHDPVAEEAVRAYLTFLVDPGRLVDQEHLRRIEETIARATDPIERLLALGEFERASTVDGEALVAAFIRYAKLWALREDISVNAFRQFGVSANVLRAAGLTGPSRRTDGLAAMAAARSANRRSMTAHEIDRIVRGWSGEFLAADIASKIGGSPMTIRKALDGLLAAGVVRRIGPVVGHTGPGRAPIRYERITSTGGSPAGTHAQG